MFRGCQKIKLKDGRGLPLWLSGKESACQWVPSLVLEDTTCLGATKLMCHNYWSCALEPGNHNYWAHALQLPKPTGPRASALQKRNHHTEKPAQCNDSSPCSLQLENADWKQWRPSVTVYRHIYIYISTWKIFRNNKEKFYRESFTIYWKIHSNNYQYKVLAVKIRIRNTSIDTESRNHGVTKSERVAVPGRRRNTICWNE